MKWRALWVLAAAQFLMVLDASVMNVSISQLVDDFDTTVTTIQGVITFYALTMAALMLTGGKLGDRFGRRRAFWVGLLVYASGSALTAAAWNVPSLLIGWSVLEGVGAALVMPALVALVGGTYRGADRAVAYGVIGGVAGAGIAVGPILGGWVTTNLSWRLVFVGEVVLALAIVAAIGWVSDAARERPYPNVDWVGSGLSILGLGLFVFGILQTSVWGWLVDKSSPFAPFGLSLTPFVVGLGLLILSGFLRWSAVKERRREDALVRLALFDIGPLRAGLKMVLGQNVILMGVFFAIPLYLQVVLGLDAFSTGVRMLPVSISMFVMSFVGARMSHKWTPKAIIRAGLWILLVSVAILMATIQPEIRGWIFGFSMALLGIGMGLLASQLGNVVMSSVEARDRGGAGGLQYTALQLGSAIGTALIGAIVITTLAGAFLNQIADDPRISEAVDAELEVELATGVPFVRSAEVETALAQTDLDPAEATAILEAYESSQLTSLKLGLLTAALIVVWALYMAREVPDVPFAEFAEMLQQRETDATTG